MTWYGHVISGLLSASFICLSSCEQQEVKSYKSTKVETAGSKITHERNLELSSAEHPPKIEVRPIDKRNEIQKLAEEKLRMIIIPLLDFENAPAEEVIDFMRIRSIEVDPEPETQFRGTSIRIMPPNSSYHPNSTLISIYEKDISLWETLNLIAKKSDMKFSIDELGFVVLTYNDTHKTKTTAPPSNAKEEEWDPFSE